METTVWELVSLFQTGAKSHAQPTREIWSVPKLYQTGLILDEEGLKFSTALKMLLTSQSSTSTSTSTEETSQQQQPVNWEKEKDLKEEFDYLEQVARTTVRSTETMRNCMLRIGEKIASKFFEYEMPEMCKTIPTIFTAFFKARDISAFDQLIWDTFKSIAWRDILKALEDSYRTSGIDYNNLLVSSENSSRNNNSLHPEGGGGVASLDQIPITEIMKHVRKRVADPSLTNTDRQFVDSEMQKSFSTNRMYCSHSKTVLEDPDDETLQIKSQGIQKLADQLKTPVYKIEEIHRMRQEIVAEGLDACISQFKIMREKVIYEIPIQSDEEAYAWRDGFIDLANNFTSLGDNKHRMDFASWARTLENIEKYGSEKGLKVSGQEITEKDLKMVDEKTLPLHYYEAYKKIGLSYISKEHLDSKGVIIANCFVDMMNHMSWLAAAAQEFSYQAKIRGIRAIAVSNKLSNSK